MTSNFIIGLLTQLFLRSPSPICFAIEKNKSFNHYFEIIFDKLMRETISLVPSYIRLSYFQSIVLFNMKFEMKLSI